MMAAMENVYDGKSSPGDRFILGIFEKTREIL
jgi:hypothetical protein